MHVFKIMDRTGHSVLEHDELEKARASFDSLVGDGRFFAAKLLDNGNHEKIDTFDPAAEETLFVPRLQGG